MVIERKLCCFEESLVRRSLFKIYYNFQIGVKYVNPSFTLPDIKFLLVQLCNQWPQLVLQIDQKSILRPLKQIKLSDLIVDLSERKYINDQEAVDSIFNEYTYFQFEYGNKSPLWKIIIYKDILIFLADHVLFDGTSGRLFHQFAGEYLESINNETLADSQCSYDDEIFNLDNHPNFLINPSPAELQSDFFPPGSWSPSNPIANALPNFNKELLKLPLVDHYSSFYHINDTLTKRLISVARVNNVKVTSVIFGLVSTSLMSTGILKGGNLTSAIPINTRFKIKPQNGVLEYPFASLYTRYLHSTIIADSPSSFKDKNFWKYCQDFHKKLNASFKECLYSSGKAEKEFLSNPKLPSDAMQALASMEKNVCPAATIVISNLGAISSNTCTDCWFDQAMSDAAFGCHLIGTPKGICFNFTAHRAISLEDYNAYVKSSTKNFESFLKDL